jgi:putative glycosyltransferase
VYLIDSDLEEPPELLGQFYNELQSNDYDVVYAFQRARTGGPMKRVGGGVAWYLVRTLYSVDAPRNHCTLRLMRREYVDALLRHREQPPVLGALFVITGFRQHGIPIDKGHRAKSSYTLGMRISVFLEGLTSFSTVPLRLISFFGLGIAFLAAVFGVFIVLQKLIYDSSVGWASVMASVWFLGGAIIFCTGVLGIYVNHVFIEVKNRPYTIVRRVHENGTHNGAVSGLTRIRSREL